MVTLLASFWMVGNIMTSLIAWLIIPNVGMSYKLGSLTYGSWRIFVAIGALPSLSSALFFLFLPESPKFLLEVCTFFNCFHIFRDYCKKMFMWLLPK